MKVQGIPQENKTFYMMIDGIDKQIYPRHKIVLNATLVICLTPLTPNFQISTFVSNEQFE